MIRALLPEELHTELMKKLQFHGQLSNIIRGAVREFVNGDSKEHKEGKGKRCQK